MEKPRKLRIIELNISSLTKEGHGLGHFLNGNGRTQSIEVPFTVPGDSVKASLRKKNRGVYQGNLEEIIQPSPHRIQPRCSHFGYCGGCRWQHTAYENQLRLKEQFIQTCFAPYIQETTKIYPIIACLPPWEYRNKMEFSFSSDRANNRYLGLIIQGSRGKVFNMQECYLTHSWFVDGVKAVFRWWTESGLDAYHPSKNTGSLRTLTMREGRRTGDRLIMLTVSGNPDFALNRKQLNDFCAVLSEAIGPKEDTQKLSIFLRIQQIAKGRPTNFYEMLLLGPDHIREELYIQDEEGQESYKLSFRISPTAFFQPNTEQAERLYSRALQLACIPKNAKVFDLYCGTGTLGICAARKAQSVIGIELTPESVLDAKENMKLNNLNNVEIISGDVGQTLQRLISEGRGQADVVMVDPPRAGLDRKAIQHILEIKAPTLVYISCNPATQGANLEELTKGGYQLESIQPVDQFPQTVHVENIAVLRMK